MHLNQKDMSMNDDTIGVASMKKTKAKVATESMSVVEPDTTNCIQSLP